MNLTDFQQLPTSELANIVKTNSIQVCGFTFNGTRRWFSLEYPKQQNDPKAYIAALAKSVIDTSKMLFEHGISTLVLPVISPYVLEKRDAAYKYMATQALKLLVSSPAFLCFYEEYDVAAYLYGDYERYLTEETAVYLDEKNCVLNNHITNHSRRIFWGICAHDATDSLAKLTIEHFQEHGQVPTKNDLIKRYYGADFPPLDLYIGSSKLQVIDMPLISTGRESLYFTVSPSPYFCQTQLRDLLYDHIYQRRECKDHARITEENAIKLRQFYRANQCQTLGVGTRNSEWDVWHPIPQVKLPQKNLVSQYKRKQTTIEKLSTTFDNLLNRTRATKFLAPDNSLAVGGD